MKEITVEAKTDRLDDILEFVHGQMVEYGFSTKEITQVMVAVEEIFVNIAHYAYPNENGKATVQVEMKNEPLTMVITFLDSGIEYNPLAREDPDVTLSAEDRKIGGLGIYIVKKSMDEVSYQYKNGQNQLTIVKKMHT